MAKDLRKTLLLVIFICCKIVAAKMINISEILSLTFA